MTSPTWPPGGSTPPNVPAGSPYGAPAPGQMPPGTWGTAAPATNRPAGTTRWGDAALLAVASAGIAGVLWWAAVAFTKTQVSWGAIGVGFLVGVATATGARRNNAGTATLAAACTLVALVVAEYFIRRTIAVNDGITGLPLWNGFGFFRQVVRESIDQDPLTLLFWLLAVGAAGFTTFRR